MAADLFPIPYETWYAATLFLETGYPREEVLRRVGLDEQGWTEGTKLYSYLHFAGARWVQGSFSDRGLRAPEQDYDLYTRLLAGGTLPPPARSEPFSIRLQLKTLRRMVEANPRIGPFSDVDWIAIYVGERSFPTIRYVSDGHSVMVWGKPLYDQKGEIIEGIDPSSFRQLGDRWFRDRQRVYCQGETPTMRFWCVVRDADPDSFRALNERYAADKAAGYYVTNRRLPAAEPGTFEIVGYQYAQGQKPGFHVNESHYAKNSQRVYAYGEPIEGADAPTFHAIGDEGIYFADINRIYCKSKPVEGADRESFRCASDKGQYLAYDKDRPYWQGRPESVSDRFESWSEYFEARSELTDTWWHKEKARRAQGSPGTGGAVSVGGPFFSDGERVLVRKRDDPDGPMISLDHFDHASFRHIVDVFAADKSGLRFFTPGYEKYGEPSITGADPSTFEALGDGWYRDAAQAYYFDAGADPPRLAIMKADMNTFQTLGGAYARDAKGLVCQGVRKRKIDAGQVIGLGRLYARMGDQILYKCKVVPKLGQLDISTARGFHDRLLMDASGNMLVDTRYRKPVPGLDVPSFRFLNLRFAVDADRVYALDDVSLRICDIADRATIESASLYAVRDCNGAIRLSRSSQFERTS
jgi:hypothetical protein